MGKYILIDIKDAKFYLEKQQDNVNKIFRKQNDDYTRDNVKRSDEQYVKTPQKETDIFTGHQISGLLHYLLGYRPVSHFYKRAQKEVPEIREMADNAYVKATNTFMVPKNENASECYCEATQTNKPSWNSKRQDLFTITENYGTIKGLYLTWNIIKKKFFFNKEKLNKIMDFFCTLTPDKSLCERYEFLDYLLMLCEDEDIKQKCIDFCNENGLAVIVNIINENLKAGILQFNNPANQGRRLNKDLSGVNLAGYTNPKGFTNKVSLSGTIAIRVTDEYAEKFKNGMIFGRFGDEGLAEVREFPVHWDEEDLLENGFTKIEF